MNNKNLDLQKAIAVGLDVLSDPQNRIPSNTIEDLAVFKGILKSLLKGELTLATPDRILPEGAKLPDSKED